MDTNHYNYYHIMTSRHNGKRKCSQSYLNRFRPWVHIKVSDILKITLLQRENFGSINLILVVKVALNRLRSYFAGRESVKPYDYQFTAM